MIVRVNGERERLVESGWSGHIVFISQASSRRHWCYPANWLTCATAALLDLMNQPRPAVR